MIERIKSLLCRYPLEFAGLAALAMLSAAWTFEHGFGYAPCDLCYLQRDPYKMVIAVAVIGFGWRHFARESFTPMTVRTLLGLCMVGFMLTSGIGFFHAGVEQGWWEGPTTCSAAPMGGSAEELLADIMNAPLIRCDEIAWSLFGLSMAAWNGFIALGLAGVTFTIAKFK